MGAGATLLARRRDGRGVEKGATATGAAVRVRRSGRGRDIFPAQPSPTAAPPTSRYIRHGYRAAAAAAAAAADAADAADAAAIVRPADRATNCRNFLIADSISHFIRQLSNNFQSITSSKFTCSRFLFLEFRNSIVILVALSIYPSFHTHF